MLKQMLLKRTYQKCAWFFKDSWTSHCTLQSKIWRSEVPLIESGMRATKTSLPLMLRYYSVLSGHLSTSVKEQDVKNALSWHWKESANLAAEYVTGTTSDVMKTERLSLVLCYVTGNNGNVVINDLKGGHAAALMDVVVEFLGEKLGQFSVA